jgi:uncharacterized protein (DUF58 family)
VKPAGSPGAPSAAALGIALVLVGLGFDIPSVLLPGVALALLAVVAVAWVELASRGGRLERDPGPRRLAEDRPYPLRIRLRGTLVRPPSGRLVDPLLPAPVAVGPRWPRELRRQVPVRGPGRRAIGRSRLEVRDPLRLWTRELVSEPAPDLVVLPRIEPIQVLGPGGDALGSGGSAGGSPQRAAVEIAQFEIDGLRPYRPGSPASRIHWPAVARHGELIERRLTGGEGSRPLVVLDLRGAEGRDRAIRAAASLCLELAGSGGCELLLPGARRTLTIDPARRSWPEAHVRLAVAAGGAPGAIGAGLRAGAVLWVSSAGSPPNILSSLGPGSYLIAPGRPRGEASFKVAGCYGRPLAAPGRPRARRARAAR